MMHNVHSMYTVEEVDGYPADSLTLVIWGKHFPRTVMSPWVRRRSSTSPACFLASKQHLGELGALCPQMQLRHFVVLHICNLLHLTEPNADHKQSRAASPEFHTWMYKFFRNDLYSIKSWLTWQNKVGVFGTLCQRKRLKWRHREGLTSPQLSHLSLIPDSVGKISCKQAGVSAGKVFLVVNRLTRSKYDSICSSLDCSLLEFLNVFVHTVFIFIGHPDMRFNHFHAAKRTEWPIQRSASNSSNPCATATMRSKSSQACLDHCPSNLHHLHQNRLWHASWLLRLWPCGYVHYIGHEVAKDGPFGMFVQKYYSKGYYCWRWNNTAV